MKTLTRTGTEWTSEAIRAQGMRILILTNLYPPHVLGGYEILCGQVVDRLRRRGHTLQVLTSEHCDTACKENDDEAQNVQRTLKLYAEFGPPVQTWRWRRRTASFHNAQVTRRVIDEFRPDVVFHWSPLRMTMGAARAAEACGRPVLYTFNDENVMSFAPSSWSRPHRAMLDFTVCKHPTISGLKFLHSTCISALLKRNLLARGLPIENSRVIHQGIPVQGFPMKEQPGVIHSPLRVLYAGQLHAYKGVHTVVEACHRVAREGPVELTIAGAGSDAYTARLRDMAAAGPAMVVFTGMLDQTHLAGQYRRADVFVFPSEWEEPFGLTHLEAMASGTPTISTTHGGQGEFIEDGLNALAMTSGDVRVLTEKVRLLRDNAPLRMRLAYTARQLVEARFTLERYAAQLELFLAELVLQARDLRPGFF